ncbi:MAG: hypothetical protein K1X61_07710 [Chitinophagales bacterium]|nr:hypothetical protein [Chitinophagales bacterium]
MIRNIILLLTLTLTFLSASGQDAAALLLNGAVKVDNPEQLSDSVYKMLSSFQIVMVGEMHGTNKPAQLVTGLAKLFTSKGDSVQVGLEILPEQMQRYNSLHTDSSIYKSQFFANPPQQDGRASFAWANIIARLNDNPKVQIFFYDINKGKEEMYSRDSIMFSKIKKQYLLHPTWKMITISGNAHNSNQPDKMITYLRKDKELNLDAKTICSLNNYYAKGTCNANFGKGLELKYLESPESAYDTILPFPDYLYLYSAKSNAPYTGAYYTRYMTPAKMVFNYQEKIDTAAIHKQLKAIFDRDQKTRARGDSSQFMGYIDSTNQIVVEALINKYGWLDRSIFGAASNYVCYIVIQHAPIEKQKKYLPMLMQSVADDESRSVDLAYLQDRVLMRENKKQIYGSQLVPDKETGGWKFYPIEDEKNVNIRRAKIGLEPMEEYAKNFGIDYQLPNN